LLVKRVEAATLARSLSVAPLILFEDALCDDESNFDLVIPPLTFPDVWLREVAATIERSRMLGLKSAAIREQSRWLVKQSEAVREKSLLEREKSVRQRQIAEKVIRQFRKGPWTCPEDK
jgi:hypothetical protein